MIPRLDIRFPLRRQWEYWYGAPYVAREGEYLLNHARTGIVMALRAALPHGGRVGVVAYNCHTVANAVVNARCVPVFVDVCPDLRVDVESVPRDLDAIVVTNLFGIRNDIEAIRKRCLEAVVIVDNAHGYGLPVEGDFTVYSINQGKFPALGEGGILKVNLQSEEIVPLAGKEIINHKLQIDSMYEYLPKYSLLGQLKLFCSMWVKAVAYSKLCYWFVRRLKKGAKLEVHQEVVMKQMAPGIRRLYQAWLPKAEAEIEMQRQNAEKIDGAIYGDNAFMAIVRTDEPVALKAEYAAKGVETETHFKHCIEWAEQFGYKRGDCPKAEELTKQLLMIPTYKRV